MDLEGRSIASGCNCCLTMLLSYLLPGVLLNPMAIKIQIDQMDSL